MPCAPIEIDFVIATGTLNLIFHIMMFLACGVITWLENNFFVLSARRRGIVRVVTLRTGDKKFGHIGHKIFTSYDCSKGPIYLKKLYNLGRRLLHNETFFLFHLRQYEIPFLGWIFLFYNQDTWP